MAFTSIKEGYTGVESGGSVLSSGTKRTATRVFTVVTDTPCSPVWTFPVTDGTVTIPASGTSHPDYASLYSGVAVVTRKAPCYFEVKVPYETPDPSNPMQQYEDPLEVPADISWDDAERTVAYDTDLDDNLIINSMEEPFDPPLTRQVCDPVLVIERNQAAFDPDDKLDYQDSVSSNEFWGAPAGRARMGKIKARSVNGETPYWRVRYEIIFRMKTPTGTPADKSWWRQILDQGLTYKGTDGKTYNAPPGKTVLLAADGTKTTAASPHWLFFREYPDMSWTGLGLE